MRRDFAGFARAVAVLPGTVDFRSLVLGVKSGVDGLYVETTFAAPAGAACFSPELTDQEPDEVSNGSEESKN